MRGILISIEGSADLSLKRHYALLISQRFNAKFIESNHSSPFANDVCGLAGRYLLNNTIKQELANYNTCIVHSYVYDRVATHMTAGADEDWAWANEVGTVLPDIVYYVNGCDKLSFDEKHKRLLFEKYIQVLVTQPKIQLPSDLSIEFELTNLNTLTTESLKIYEPQGIHTSSVQSGPRFDSVM